MPDPRIPLDHVGRLLADVVALLDRAIDLRAKKIGITGPQGVVLLRIDDGSGTTAAKLCRSTDQDSGSMTRMLDRLDGLGLIKRERSELDRRVVQVSLSETGRQMHQQLRPIAAEVLGSHLKGFTPAEIDQLTGFLGRMLENGKVD